MKRRWADIPSPVLIGLTWAIMAIALSAMVILSDGDRMLLGVIALLVALTERPAGR